MKPIPLRIFVLGLLWQLAGDVKRETTVQTVEHQQHPDAVVITTVKETQTVPPPAPAETPQDPKP